MPAVPVDTTADLLYTPTGNRTVVLTNNGRFPIYLGQSGVTAVTGLPLAPGLTMSLTNVSTALYGISAPNAIKAPTLVTSGSVSAAGTALPVAAGGTAFTNGMIVSISDGSLTEIVTVGAGSTGTSVVVSALANAHASGVTFGQYQGGAGASVSVATDI